MVHLLVSRGLFEGSRVLQKKASLSQIRESVLQWDHQGLSVIDLKETFTMVRLQLDPFLNELTSMFERSTEKGSVWVTLKRSSDKSKVQRNKMATAGEAIEYRCLVRASDCKKNISTLVGAKDHQRFQASYATILKARMTNLKKRERKEKKKAAEADKKQEGSKKRSSTAKA